MTPFDVIIYLLLLGFGVVMTSFDVIMYLLLLRFGVGLTQFEVAFGGAGVSLHARCARLFR